MKMKPVVWVTEPMHDVVLGQLAAEVEVIGPGPLPENRAREVEAVIVRAMEVREGLLDRLPSLKVVGKHGAGTDNIDVEALRRRGVALRRAAGANADSVAELAVCQALMLLRAPDLHDAAIRSGANPPSVGGYKGGLGLEGMPVGIVGMGAIGREVARRFVLGFKAVVSGYDPVLPDASWPPGIVRHSSLDDVLASSRVVCLHVPLIENTRGLIGARELAIMPQGGFLVNCARGGVVDEGALASALASGHLAGAASDVFFREPPEAANPLFRTGRFIGTPHIGGATDTALRRTGAEIVVQVLDQLRQTGLPG